MVFGVIVEGNNPSYTVTIWFYITEYTAVRLVNGFDPWQGRVEVYYQGQWGTICDDGFGADDAYVICKMLGFARYRYEITNNR